MQEKAYRQYLTPAITRSMNQDVYHFRIQNSKKALPGSARGMLSQLTRYLFVFCALRLSLVHNEM